MLRNYPTTQLFLISLVVLLALVFVTPLVSELNFYFASVLESLKFIVKVVCGLLLFGTIVIDIIDGVNYRNHGHHH